MATSARSPGTAQAAKHYRRGLEDFRGGRFREAARNIRKAVEIDPANIDWRYDLAVALQKAERHEDAVAEYRRVLEAGGEAADALTNLALCLRALGRLHEAEPAAERAAALAPGSAEVLHNLGIVRDALGRADAVAILERAAELSRGAPNVLNDLGVALDRAGELERAESCFRRALAVDPRLRAARENLAGVLYAMERLAEAEAVARALVADEPASAEGHLRLALYHLCNGERDAAVALARRVVELAPTADHWNFLGQVLRECGDPEGAVAAIGEALRLQPGFPDASLNLAYALLGIGRYADAWQAYLRRPRKPALPEGAAPLEPADVPSLAGKRVLLVGEQGPGDELFFLRYAPALRARGATLAYYGDPRLASLLRSIGLFDALASRESPPPAADRAALVGDLPALLGADETAPRPPSLRLAADPDLIARLRSALAAAGPPPYVAVTWQAGPVSSRWNAAAQAVFFKRVPPELLGAALRDVPATIVIVQRSAAPPDAAAFARALGRAAPDFTPRDDDLAEALALMALVDEYVAVSNTSVHLRAAAGRTARVLTPLPPEWRWGAAGDESPWFPGFRIYREAPATGWGDALARLGSELAAAPAAQEHPALAGD
jgi:Flp pilus assembly protein TadD